MAGIVDRDDVGLVFPSDVKVDRQNNLWVFSDRMPVFLISELDYNDINFRIYQIPVADAIRGTVCDYQPGQGQVQVQKYTRPSLIRVEPASQYQVVPKTNLGPVNFHAITLGQEPGLRLANQNQGFTLANQNQGFTLANQNQGFTLANQNQGFTLANQNQALRTGLTIPNTQPRYILPSQVQTNAFQRLPKQQTTLPAVLYAQPEDNLLNYKRELPARKAPYTAPQTQAIRLVYNH